jgi:hypothetical protein
VTGTESFDIDSLLAAARSETGLDDFGSADFEEGLRVLATSIDREAGLTAAGRQAQRARLVGSLCTRLVAQDHWNRHPEILDEEIQDPVFVVGLARTGTTRLHRLLACAPDAYSVLWWQARWPSPLADDPGWRSQDARIAAAHAEIDAILETQPVLASIHPWDAEGADEEIMLCEHAFRSWVPEAFMNVPSYIDWLSREDMLPTYRYLERMLKFLQWQKREAGSHRKRWVLKAPFHLGFGAELFATFPSAKVIQTHRDPVETLPSIASMAYALWGLGSEDADPLEVGRQAFARWSGAIQTFLDFRASMPEERFLDCDFRAVGRDPLGEIERIHAWLGVPLAPEARALMEEWLVLNAREKRAPHEYSLETFGLERVAIEEGFAPYRRRFVDP